MNETHILLSRSKLSLYFDASTSFLYKICHPKDCKHYISQINLLWCEPDRQTASLGLIVNDVVWDSHLPRVDLKMSSSDMNATILFGSILPVILQEYTLGGGIPLIIWIHDNVHTSKFWTMINIRRNQKEDLSVLIRHGKAQNLLSFLSDFSIQILKNAIRF